jgi:hypothetical protein
MRITFATKILLLKQNLVFATEIPHYYSTSMFFYNKASNFATAISLSQLKVISLNPCIFCTLHDFFCNYVEVSAAGKLT